MHAILSFSNLGSKRIKTAKREKLESYYTHINSSANRLLKLINNLLDASKLESGAGGTGLGLAICKEIIQAHNGEIWANSTESGVSFDFSIPTR